MLEKFREMLRCCLTPESAGLMHHDRRRQLLQLLAECDTDSDDSVQTLVTLSRDYDGFVREAATVCLAKSPTPAALQAIVLRLNDWVHQVRQAAQTSAAMFLETERLPAVLAALEAIVRLSGKSRTDHSPFVDQVGAFLDRPEHRSPVLARFRKSRGPVASFLLSRLLRWPEAGQAEVVRLCTQHKDFLVRSRFLSACEASGTVGEAALHALLADRHPRNRQKAFLAYGKVRPLTGRGCSRRLCSTHPLPCAAWRCGRQSRPASTWQHLLPLRAMGKPWRHEPISAGYSYSGS